MNCRNAVEAVLGLGGAVGWYSMEGVSGDGRVWDVAATHGRGRTRCERPTARGLREHASYGAPGQHPDGHRASRPNPVVTAQPSLLHPHIMRILRASSSVGAHYASLTRLAALRHAAGPLSSRDSDRVQSRSSSAITRSGTRFMYTRGRRRIAIAVITVAPDNPLIGPSVSHVRNPPQSCFITPGQGPFSFPLQSAALRTWRPRSTASLSVASHIASDGPPPQDPAAKDGAD